MRINNNISALNTFRQYTANTNASNRSMEKLSSGLRINRAGDDAAGLAISEKMRAQIRGLKMASKNSQDAISLVQTAEGALTETHAILQRMRELSVQSASDTNEDIDRVALQSEFSQLRSEINDIASQTKFNNMVLLDGSFGGAGIDPDNSTVFTANILNVTADGQAATIYTFTDAGANLVVSDGTTSVTITGGTMAAGAQTLEIEQFGIKMQTSDGFAAAGLNGKTITFVAGTSGIQVQTGANQGDYLNISMGAMTTASLTLDTTDVGTLDNAQNAITSVGSAMEKVSAQRAELGAYQNRLQHKINNLDTSAENLQAAESRIRDVDMAEEMMEFTKNSILLQAAQAMLAQANAQPQGVLQLLK